MEKKFNTDHILIQILYFLTVSSMLGFGTYTMLDRGYSASYIAMLIAGADLLTIIINFCVSSYLDKSKTINVFQMAMILAVLGLLVFGINFFCSSVSVFLSIIYILSFSLHSTLAPLLDSVNTSFIRNGYNIHFGIGRSFGSLSYGLACFAFGFISERFDYRGIMLPQIVFQLILILVLFKTDRDFSSAVKKEYDDSEDEKIDYASFLKNHPSFIFSCIGYAGLMSCSTLLLESFLLPLIYSVGGTVFDSGMIQGIKAFMEIPFIFCFHLIERRIPLKTIFMISGLSFVLRNKITYSMTSVVPLYLSQILQCTSFALIVPGFVSYINRTMRKNETARAYALQAIVMTSIMMITNFIGGYVFDYYGIKALCLMAIIISSVSTAVLVTSVQKDK